MERPHSCGASTGSTSATERDEQRRDHRARQEHLRIRASRSAARMTVAWSSSADPLPISVYREDSSGSAFTRARGPFRGASATPWSNRPSRRATLGQVKTVSTAGHLAHSRSTAEALHRQLRRLATVILMDEPCRPSTPRASSGSSRCATSAAEVHDRVRHTSHGSGPPRQPRVLLQAPRQDRRATPHVGIFRISEAERTEMYVGGTEGLKCGAALNLVARLHT